MSTSLLRSDRVRLSVLALAWVLFVAAVYCPDVGRGFIKDDFTWIRTAKAAIADPSTVVLQREVGFYRPVVTLTFVSDYVLNGWGARGYGWTNLALYVFCGAALSGLARAMGLNWWVAALSAFLWAINPHGINMAILWLSGRTALCLTLFAMLAGIAFLRQWYGAAAVLIALALASKEEAVMLPAILLAWTWLRDRRVPWPAVCAACVPLGAYFLIRSFTPALTPASAPSFYRFTADPLLVARNLGEYLDRTTTIFVAVIVLAALVYRARPHPGEADTRVLAMMVVWSAGLFAITIWLPVRSSLYAVCPSAGTAVIAAMMLDRMRSGATAGRRWLEPVLAIALLAAVPLYQQRDGRLVESARISARTLRTIRADLTELPRTGLIVLHDEPAVASFQNAFGSLATEAMRTAFDRDWNTRVETQLASSTWPGGANAVAAEYRIDRGRISRVAPR